MQVLGTDGTSATLHLRVLRWKARCGALKGMLIVGISLMTMGTAAATTVVIQQNSQTTIINGETGPPVIASTEIGTDNRVLGSYSGIQLDAPAQLTFTLSNSASAKVTAPVNILPLVTTDVRDHLLIIGLKGSVIMGSAIQIAASAPQLDAVSISGSGTARVAELLGSKLQLSLSGSGSIVASGSVEAIHARIAGSGDIDVSAVKALDVSANISGSGSIQAFAKRKISADISGSGDLVIFGNPPARPISISGSGRVVFR